MQDVWTSDTSVHLDRHTFPTTLFNFRAISSLPVVASGYQAKRICVCCIFAMSLKFACVLFNFWCLMCNFCTQILKSNTKCVACYFINLRNYTFWQTLARFVLCIHNSVLCYKAPPTLLAARCSTFQKGGLKFDFMRSNWSQLFAKLNIVFSNLRKKFLLAWKKSRAFLSCDANFCSKS